MKTALLLIVSNVFMTFAWYGHIASDRLKAAPLWIVVFVAFSVLFLPEEKLRWNHGVGFGLLLAAVFFVYHKW